MTKTESGEDTNQAKQMLLDVGESLRAIFTQPMVFLDSLPLSGGYIQPIVFTVAMALISAVGAFLIKPLPLQSLLQLIVWIALSFINAGYLMVLCRGLGGEGDYEGTYRMYSYAMAPSAFYWIPLVNVIGLLYSIFLLHIGLKRAHNLPTARVNAVLLIFTITFVGLFVIIAVGVVGVMTSVRNNQAGQLGI